LHKLKLKLRPKTGMAFLKECAFATLSALMYLVRACLQFVWKVHVYVGPWDKQRRYRSQVAFLPVCYLCFTDIAG
jgi:hypothetical protein